MSQTWAWLGGKNQQGKMKELEQESHKSNNSELVQAKAMT